MDHVNVSVSPLAQFLKREKCIVARSASKLSYRYIFFFENPKKLAAIRVDTHELLWKILILINARISFRKRLIYFEYNF